MEPRRTGPNALNEMNGGSHTNSVKQHLKPLPLTTHVRKQNAAVQGHGYSDVSRPNTRQLHAAALSGATPPMWANSGVPNACAGEIPGVPQQENSSADVVAPNANTSGRRAVRSDVSMGSPTHEPFPPGTPTSSLRQQHSRREMNSHIYSERDSAKSNAQSMIASRADLYSSAGELKGTPSMWTSQYIDQTLVGSLETEENRPVAALQGGNNSQDISQTEADGGHSGTDGKACLDETVGVESALSACQPVQILQDADTKAGSASVENGDLCKETGNQANKEDVQAKKEDVPAEIWLWRSEMHRNIRDLIHEADPKVNPTVDGKELAALLRKAGRDGQVSVCVRVCVHGSIGERCTAR